MEISQKSLFYLHELRKHCTWVMNEKRYLDDMSHSGFIDGKLFAATFRTAVTKDDKPTLHYIRDCLEDMPVDLACMNASALLKECDRARLDNGIHRFNDDNGSWQFDSLATDVTVMMADIIVDVTQRLILQEHLKPGVSGPDDTEIKLDTIETGSDNVPPSKVVNMINSLDNLLHFLPHETDMVYHRLLGLLRDSFETCHSDESKSKRKVRLPIRKAILAGIWKHIAVFKFSGQCSQCLSLLCVADALSDAKSIRKVLQETHDEEDDYSMQLELLMLALHIHESRHDSSDKMIDLLNNFLEKSSCSDFNDATNSADSHLKSVLLVDLQTDVLRATDKNILLSLSKVLRRLRWLAGRDLVFSWHDPDASNSTEPMKVILLSEVIEDVRERLVQLDSDLRS